MGLETCTEWARAHRIYGKDHILPGPRNADWTPYVGAFCESVGGDDTTSVLITGHQMGKTDALVDVFGFQANEKRRTALMVGLNGFQHLDLRDALEPIIGLVGDIDDDKPRPHQLATVPEAIAGNWSGPHGPFDINLFDEFDRMDHREGSALKLAEAAAYTYKHRPRYAVATSPHGGGVTKTWKCDNNGLEYWQTGATSSPGWDLWQRGSMHHWTWPCPSCHGYFVPRFKLLNLDRQNPGLCCPHCQTFIGDGQKNALNAYGKFVAPGQAITGFAQNIIGKPSNRTGIESFWVSGLCNPFVSFDRITRQYWEVYHAARQFKRDSGLRLRVFSNGILGELWEWKPRSRLGRPL